MANTNGGLSQGELVDQPDAYPPSFIADTPPRSSVRAAVSAKTRVSKLSLGKRSRLQKRRPSDAFKPPGKRFARQTSDFTLYPPTDEDDPVADDHDDPGTGVEAAEQPVAVEAVPAVNAVPAVEAVDMTQLTVSVVVDYFCC